MDLKLFLTIFGTVFVAEMADKTQLVTMLFASNKDVSKLTVFMGSALGLVTASAIGVLLGSLFSNYINEKTLRYVAGVGFIAIGIYTLVRS